MTRQVIIDGGAVEIKDAWSCLFRYFHYDDTGKGRCAYFLPERDAECDLSEAGDDVFPKDCPLKDKTPTANDLIRALKACDDGVKP
jgi:hypothetical protein